MDHTKDVSPTQKDKPPLVRKVGLPAGPIENVSNKKKKRAREEDSDNEIIDDRKRPCIHLLDVAMKVLKINSDKNSKSKSNTDTDERSSSNENKDTNSSSGKETSKSDTVSDKHSLSNKSIDTKDSSSKELSDESKAGTDEHSASNKKLDTTNGNNSNDEVPSKSNTGTDEHNSGDIDMDICDEDTCSNKESGASNSGTDKHSASDMIVDNCDENSSSDENMEIRMARLIKRESAWSVGSDSSDEDDDMDVSDAESWGYEHMNDSDTNDDEDYQYERPRGWKHIEATNTDDNNNSNDDEHDGRLRIQPIQPIHQDRVKTRRPIIQEDVDDTSSEDELEGDDCMSDAGCVDVSSSTAFPGCEYLEKFTDSPGRIYILTSGGKDVIIKITTYDPPILFRVSVKNLIRGSSVYAKFFGYNEEIANGHVWGDKDEERVFCPSGTEIVYDDINPVAMLTVLRAMHRYSCYLRVELALLKDIAVIVDRFQLQGALELFMPTWLSNAYLREDGKNIPNHAELLDWVLYITWVFRAEKDFRQATRGLIMDYYALPDPPKNPYTPKSIYDAIYNARRQVNGELQSAIMEHLWCLNPGNDHRPHYVRLCSHDFRSELHTCFEFTRSPKRYKKSPNGILLEVYKVVRRAEIVGVRNAKHAKCELYPHWALHGCEKKIRECLGIGLDRRIVRELSGCEHGSQYLLWFNFDAVNWPCKKWVGEGADEYPYQDPFARGHEVEAKHGCRS
ncbi:hypothetical protein AbraIFM66951_010540 [Aspergillus brasiliensis]|uniref:BTB domain-containing protein n=1 Tax=Aspergillus brasiliensis TaxID=319629 RepID=A0A9W5YXW9_9EURO|nr:hypothetical protein AbraCBS73388_010655 [Aspergillus brasiliensis]GKZ47190.1 hypothetical protein AbraIFM66951_010540 [Aspergillus brasiliensis]